MPSLKAWLQGTGALAHLQLVQRPLPHSLRKGREARIADLVFAQKEGLEGRQRPALNRLSKSGEACVANVVVVQPQLLCIKQMFCVRRVHMPSLKAWLQGTGAPAHLQLVQRPTD